MSIFPIFKEKVSVTKKKKFKWKKWNRAASEDILCRPPKHHKEKKKGVPHFISFVLPPHASPCVCLTRFTLITPLQFY